MKQMLFTVILLLLSMRIYAPGCAIVYIEQGRVLTDPFLVLWDHVKYVETRDRNLINHIEKAYGKGQITSVKLRDYNKAHGVKHTLEDCLDESFSIKVFLWHCSHYNTFEYAAKRWNGSGPLTVIYWNKVQTLPLLEYRIKSIELCQPIDTKIRLMGVDSHSLLSLSALL